jgi:hypothetical protein
MATIAAPFPAIQQPTVRGFGVFREATSDPFGEAGKKLKRLIDGVVEHWCERAQTLVRELPDDDELTYSHVPFEPVSSVRVRYRYVGELKPLPFVLDD